MAILTGKLSNCRTVLRRAFRDHPEKLDKSEVDLASKLLKDALNRLQSELPLNVLRGIEGEATLADGAVRLGADAASGAQKSFHATP